MDTVAIFGGAPNIARPLVEDKENNESTTNAEQIAGKIFNTVEECAFDSGKTAVCSPTEVVKEMGKFIEQKQGKVLKDKKQIITTMKDMLNCNSESCVLKRKDFVEFAKQHDIDGILAKFFKPEGPSTNFGLLSNFNIDDVLSQLGKKFPERAFLHIPFQMRDFEKIGSELSRVDLAKEFSNGKKTFGVVLNTDYSSGEGIHWFCLFGEHFGDRIRLEYFNSSGRPPLPEVQAWLQKNKHYLEKQLKIPVEVKHSTGLSFQNDEHSCGVYCLCYIWMRLEGVPPNWFKPNNFNDELMHQARKNLFRHDS